MIRPWGLPRELDSRSLASTLYADSRRAGGLRTTKRVRGNMSLYAEYLKERTYDEIIETDEGFATYRVIEEGKAVYIVDIYVTPEARKAGLASKLADQIAEIANSRGR